MPAMLRLVLSSLYVDAIYVHLSSPQDAVDLEKECDERFDKVCSVRITSEEGS